MNSKALGIVLSETINIFGEICENNFFFQGGGAEFFEILPI